MFWIGLFIGILPGWVMFWAIQHFYFDKKLANAYVLPKPIRKDYNTEGYIFCIEEWGCVGWELFKRVAPKIDRAVNPWDAPRHQHTHYHVALFNKK